MLNVVTWGIAFFGDMGDRVKGVFLNTNKNPTKFNSTQSDLFYCRITLRVSGVHRTHHQEY